MSLHNDVKVALWLQDKILQSMGRGQSVMVTNDGATILKSLYVDNPAAKVLVGTDLFTSTLHADEIQLQISMYRTDGQTCEAMIKRIFSRQML